MACLQAACVALQAQPCLHRHRSVRCRVQSSVPLNAPQRGTVQRCSLSHRQKRRQALKEQHQQQTLRQPLVMPFLYQSNADHEYQIQSDANSSRQAKHQIVLRPALLKALIVTGRGDKVLQRKQPCIPREAHHAQLLNIDARLHWQLILRALCLSLSFDGRFGVHLPVGCGCHHQRESTCVQLLPCLLTIVRTLIRDCHRRRPVGAIVLRQAEVGVGQLCWDEDLLLG